jgi:hypothetical protein
MAGKKVLGLSCYHTAGVQGGVAMNSCLNKVSALLPVSVLLVGVFGFTANAQVGGLGGGGGGFGGMPSGGDQLPQAGKPAPLTPDDPLVHEPTSPPANAKLTTKVGWCEVIVFGHTFTDVGLSDASLPLSHMHLPKRLEQLSRKLHFEPEKSGIQLMDSVDTLVKFVNVHKDSLIAGRASQQVPTKPAK